MTYTEAQMAVERSRHEPWLAQQEGVAGIGIGLDSGGQPCIKIYTNRMSAGTRDAILARLKSVPIEFEETGEFRAL